MKNGFCLCCSYTCTRLPLLELELPLLELDSIIGVVFSYLLFMNPFQVFRHTRSFLFQLLLRGKKFHWGKVVSSS